MVLRSDRVQDLVDRLSDPVVMLSRSDRELISWILHESWALVELRVMLLRGQLDDYNDVLWEEHAEEFYDRVESEQGPEVFNDG